MIPIVDLEGLESIKALFQTHLPKEALESYRLPVADTRAQVILGLSGGADSTVLALFAAVYLAPIYPNLKAVFTDTQAEPDSCYETLEKIERVTGLPIERVTPGAGLYEQIEAYGGFLPSANARWCTKELKLLPLLEYFRTLPDEHGLISLAGIRSDEADRDGLILTHSMESQTTTAYPFVDLGITRTIVFDILDRSPVGIPRTYAYRSRSGCSSCFFQRRSEIVGMLANDPRDFATAESVEKLTPEDHQRWDDIPQALTDLGIQAFYPVPAFIDIRKPQSSPSKKEPAPARRQRDQETLDLLDESGQAEDTLYVAYALFVDEALGLFGGREWTPGVYWQEIAALSPSLAGLKASLANYYRFKATTPMPMADPADMKVVMMEVKFPNGTVDLGEPSADSYTWKPKEAYKQLRHLAKHLQLTLERRDLETRHAEAAQAVQRAKNIDARLDAEEALESNVHALRKAPSAPGKVTWEGIFTPKADDKRVVQMQLDGISVETDMATPRHGLEYDEVPTACVMCSL